MQICMYWLHLYAWDYLSTRLLHLLNRLVPQPGKEMHHWDTVSDKTPKVPAGSCASLIQRYLLSYCESILFSSRRLQFVTPALVILQLTSSSHLILSLCHTLQHLSLSSSSPLYSSTFSNSGFSSGQSR